MCISLCVYTWKQDLTDHLWNGAFESQHCSKCCHTSTLEDGTFKWLERNCLEIIQTIEQIDFRRLHGGADDTPCLEEQFISLHVRHLLGVLLQIVVDLTGEKIFIAGFSTDTSAMQYFWTATQM